MKTKQQLIEQLEDASPVTEVYFDNYTSRYVLAPFVMVNGYANAKELRYIADRLEALIELEKIDKTPEKRK